MLPIAGEFKAFGDWCDAVHTALCRNHCQVSALHKEFVEAYQLAPQESEIEHKPTRTLGESANSSDHLQKISKGAVVSWAAQ